MPILAMVLAAQTLPTALPAIAPCRPAQLRLSLDAKDGAFNGMSHSGVELSVRNLGPDCSLAAVPMVVLSDRHNRKIAVRQAPPGMHPGPVMIPVWLGGGHRAATELRWVSGPVYPTNRSLHATMIAVRIGNRNLRAPLTAVIYGAVGKPITFTQTPLRVMEGMAAEQ